jgi:hypothetical protein
MVWIGVAGVSLDATVSSGAEKFYRASHRVPAELDFSFCLSVDARKANSIGNCCLEQILKCGLLRTKTISSLLRVDDDRQALLSQKETDRLSMWTKT